MTVNPVSNLCCYPIPRVEDLLATLSKGKVFTKLDQTQVYQQLKLHAHSQLSSIHTTVFSINDIV